GLTWVGPSPAALELFGDKRATRQRAVELGIPVPAATGLLEGDGGTAVAAVRRLLAEHPDGIAIKAVAGGGGRGIRLVTDASELERALTACAAEARAGFGDDRVFAEALVTDARHIEVQVLGTRGGAGGHGAGEGAGDGSDEHVVVLGDRDCSIQRRRQKLVEVAPAPHLSDDLRARLHAD